MRVLAVVVLGALALAGCAVGPSQRPPVATRVDGPVLPTPTDETDAPAPAPPLLPPLVPSPQATAPFTDCTATLRASLGAAALGGRDLRFGCATLPVGGRGESSPAEIAVLQVTLGPPPPGGPAPIAVLGDAGGLPGGRQAARLAASAPPALLTGTALYGIDLRGTGNSEPVDCITPTTREALVDADPLASDPVALGPLREAAATAARTCTQVLETALTDYRTEVGAADLEEVREALNVPRLHVLGVGDGAGVLAQWAQGHPGSVGRTVLDGVADPTASPVQRADDRARAAREALAAFATDCGARPACPLGADPAARISTVLAGLHATPLTGPYGRRVTDGTATRALVTGLGDPTTWPALASALAAAGGGNPTGLLGLLAPREADGGGFDAGILLACNDTVERRTVDQVAGDAARARAGDPVFGAYFAQQALVCTSWPVPTAALPLPSSSGPPALVLGTEGDPSTPLTGTRRVAAQLGSATLVTWLGAGHGAYPLTPCVTDAVGRYLVEGQLPQQGTVCPP